jgi:predicted amidohydrolase
MTFRVALAQCESVIGTTTFDPRPANLARASTAVEAAAAQGADVVLFGEMYLTGYRTDEANLAWAVHLDEPDDNVIALAEICARHGVHIMVGSASVRSDAPDTVHNTALLVAADGLVAAYDKLHVGVMTMPDGTEINEARWFSPGSSVQVWDTEFGVVGPQICYDLSFPELSRAQALHGADVLLNITASAVGFETSLEHGRFARAYENGAWYVTCSIVGQQKDDRFFGRSAVVHPSGRTIVEAKEGVEDVVVADIDPTEAGRWRTRMGHLRARRETAYATVVRPLQGVPKR